MGEIERRVLQFPFSLANASGTNGYSGGQRGVPPVLLIHNCEPSHLTSGVTMSARNGDKSRFNRERKQKIARRKRTQELLKRAAAERRSMNASGHTKPQSVPA